ncbi:MAG TPA: gamma carbonic anhydrase family protein [Lacisediminihabitans sp.]|uniref:gamma carbonic anhydrase family protein n=1 Tax=Lacisediminihabitans sp. TaxID=2787631 RepID=UPI002ED7FDF9
MSLILPFGDSQPSIDPTAWVAPTATLIGAVTLGRRASVYYGAVLRADVDEIRIGDDSNIQDNVSVHGDDGVPTIVGVGVSVGHAAVLHGCVVEDGCLIGMGAVLLNRSVIGAGSLVAAGSVVLEGTVVPPGSLVAGVPATVRRPLTDTDRRHLAVNATRYLELTAVHRTLVARVEDDGEQAGHR